MTPQSELFATLLDHYPMESSLALMVEKLSDQECTDLDKAIRSLMGFANDMANRNIINLEGIMQ